MLFKGRREGEEGEGVAALLPPHHKAKEKKEIKDHPSHLHLFPQLLHHKSTPPSSPPPPPPQVKKTRKEKEEKAKEEQKQEEKKK